MDSMDSRQGGGVLWEYRLLSYQGKQSTLSSGTLFLLSVLSEVSADLSVGDSIKLEKLSGMTGERDLVTVGRDLIAVVISWHAMVALVTCAMLQKYHVSRLD